MVTSDSLAAESVRNSGKFAENRDSTPSAVSSKSSTAAVTDTSAARTLAPTSDAAHRPDWVLTPASTYRTHTEGHNDHATHAHTNNPKKSHHDVHPEHVSNTPTATPHLDRDSGNVPIAPSYVHSASEAARDEHNKPKGKHLHEVRVFRGVDESNNASFGTDIGGKDDPGRLAEEKMVRANAVPGFEAGARQKGIDGKGRYDGLQDDGAEGR